MGCYCIEIWLYAIHARRDFSFFFHSESQYFFATAFRRYCFCHKIDIFHFSFVTSDLPKLSWNFVLNIACTNHAVANLRLEENISDPGKDPDLHEMALNDNIQQS